MWINKTKEEIRDAILKIAKEETGLTSFKEGGVLRGLVETYTQTIYPIYDDVLNFLGGQFTYLKATGTMLDIRGRELGVSRGVAQKSEGNFVADAVKSGTLQAGAWFVSASGLRFKVTRNTPFHAGNNDIKVEAEFPGSRHNILPWTPIRCTTVVDGIVAYSVPSDWLTLSGRDEEPDDEYRQRIGARWESQGPDNRPGKYVSIALSNRDVNDVKVIRTPRGYGSVDIILGGIAGIPSTAVCDAVKSAIGDAYLLTRDLLVKPARAVRRDFTLSYEGKVAETEVENQLREWLQHRRIGESITMRALYYDSLSNLELSAIEFTSPTRDIAISNDSKINVGTITVTKRSA